MVSVMDAEEANPTSLADFAAHATMQITLPNKEHRRNFDRVDEALWVKQ
jgi:hypothetical protein